MDDGELGQPLHQDPGHPRRTGCHHRGDRSGHSVNVTLIFSLDRYRTVQDAYLSGLEQAHAAGRDLAVIRSVASFISWVDTEVDARLDQLGTPEAAALKGSAAIADARLAYQAHEQLSGTERWQRLARFGARPQRPLWAVNERCHQPQRARLRWSEDADEQ
jgi:Transaldolase/Fructose-6-phosphate aldolase